MKIWIDGQCFQTGSFNRGIGRYALGFLTELGARRDVELHISFNAAMSDELIGARNLLDGIIPGDRMHVWHGAAERGEAIEGYTGQREASELALAYHVEQLRPDIACTLSPFEGFNSLAVPLVNQRPSGIPLSAIVYDFIPFRYPDHFLTNDGLASGFHRRLKGLLESDLALCISNFTKDEFAAEGFEGQSVAIMAGLNDEFIRSAEHFTCQKRDDVRSYCLYVGGLDYHKDCHLILEALARLDEKDRPEKFIFAGSFHKLNTSELLKNAKRLALPSDMLIFESHVSQRRLQELYRGGIALIHPSRMEGFGLTPLEAMHSGMPVICTDGGALAEVVGNAGLKFEPGSSDQLASQIKALMTDVELWRDLQERGHERSKQFSWRHSVDIALSAFNETISRPRRKTEDSDLTRRLRAVSCSVNIKAHLMALSERPSTSTDFFVDVSETKRNDARSGIQRVVREMSRAFTTLSNTAKIHEFVVKSDSTIALTSLDPARVVEPGEPIPGTGAHVLWLDSSWLFAHEISERSRRIRCQGARSISCLYDMVPAVTPAFCDAPIVAVYNFWLLKALLYSDGFICISRAVADELHGFLKAINFPRRMAIGYWRLGADLVEVPKPQQSKTRQGERLNLLMVGTIEPRKGYEVALAACSKLWAAGHDFELHLVGRPGWRTENLIAALDNHSENGSRLHWHRDADDITLGRLYAEADHLIAASYAEGFGLPIVEAERYGVRVIASNLPVFREIATPSTTQFFAVGDPDDLASKIMTAIEDRHSSRDDAGNAPSIVSWAESAEQLVDIVSNEKWYVVYEPEHQNYNALDDLDDLIRMRSIVEPHEQRFSVNLQGLAERTADGEHLRLRICLRNQSGRFWSSVGDGAGRLAIKMAFTVQSQDDQRIDLKTISHQVFPQAVIPDVDYILSLEVPISRWKENSVLSFSLQQEDVGYWNWVHLPINLDLAASHVSRSR